MYRQKVCSDDNPGHSINGTKGCNGCEMGSNGRVDCTIVKFSVPLYNEENVHKYILQRLKKYSSIVNNEADQFIENNQAELKELSEFFAAIDEGGLSYLAKVLELSVVVTMNSDLFGREFCSEKSLFYSGTVELIGDILGLEASV